MHDESSIRTPSDVRLDSESEQHVQAVERDPILAGSFSEAPAERTALAVPSFAEVFRTYSSFVWRVLLRLGVAESDVEDVAQEVFIGVHRNLPSFEGRCAMRTWVYGICHRRAVDYRRRARGRHEVPTEEPPDVGGDAVQEDDLDLAHAKKQLQGVLDALDEDKRAVFVLFDVEGIPMEEVAEIVGCPLQTAYSRLYAARRKVEALAGRLRAQRRSL